MTIHITGDEPRPTRSSTDSPFALLVGMMLDQQYPMEHAFRGPAKVLDRFGTLDPAAIAAADPEEFEALCSTPPAIHRFPGSMAERLQTLAAHRRGASTTVTPSGSGPRRPRGPTCWRGCMALPGFGRQKAQIFAALLAKQLGVRPEGWEEAVGRLRRGRLPVGGRRVDPASLARCATSRRRRRPPPAERSGHGENARTPRPGGTGCWCRSHLLLGTGPEGPGVPAERHVGQVPDPGGATGQRDPEHRVPGQVGIRVEGDDPPVAARLTVTLALTTPFVLVLTSRTVVVLAPWTGRVERRRDIG